MSDTVPETNREHWDHKAAASNLELWNAVCRTDPKATRSFSRPGGFAGTAISPMWLIMRATEKWGPMGGRWGIRVVEEKILEGPPIFVDDGKIVGNYSVHSIQAEVWHPDGAIPCFGQTTFVGKNKYGTFMDEEAPKKSLTDALTKGLSWLGFAADVHMGRFDDVKYVADLKAEFTTNGFITSDQIDQLDTIISQCKAASVPFSLPRFLEYLGVRDIHDLPKHDFLRAMAGLKAKLEQAPKEVNT